ncbi:MAG: IMP cyclohydrolase, partial [Oscillospiraceae bacterium]
MKALDIKSELQQNSYPGRGIIIGKSEDNENIVIAYFIMGRSENSRNRIFVTDGDGIKTEAFDPKKLVDPSLIIYSPVRVLDGKTIVTNGDQTDTIYDAMSNGGCFKSALKTRTFEPDAPNFTPRISGIVRGANYGLSILKSANANDESTERFFFDYENPIAGYGHFIHTYKCDGEPIPSCEGAPKLIYIPGEIEEFTNDIWNNLHEGNK